MYRDYLENLREEEKLKEKELEEIVNKEIQKQFDKRVAQWRKDKENRKKLLQDVMNERSLQVQDKSELECSNNRTAFLTSELKKNMFFFSKCKEGKKKRSWRIKKKRPWRI